MSYKGVFELKDLKQVENYYKNNEIDMDQIIEDFTPYITTIINNGTNDKISFEDKEELKMAIENAGQYDSKILVEQGVNARELECAILDEKEIKVSTVGEILSAEEFYSFDAKYNIPESKTIIPADISKEQIEQIQNLAIKAFKAIDGKGLSRVDFFVEKETNKIYINEINTMPGFTKISMYPKLFEAVRITYTELLDKLIKNTK